MCHQQPQFCLLRLAGHFLHPDDHHVRLLRPNRPPPQVACFTLVLVSFLNISFGSINRSKAQQHQQQQRRAFTTRDTLQLDTQQQQQQQQQQHQQQLRMQSRGTQTPVSVARERRKLMWKARISFASDPPARIVRASAPPPKNWYTCTTFLSFFVPTSSLPPSPSPPPPHLHIHTGRND